MNQRTVRQLFCLFLGLAAGFWLALGCYVGEFLVVRLNFMALPDPMHRSPGSYAEESMRSLAPVFLIVAGAVSVGALVAFARTRAAHEMPQIGGLAFGATFGAMSGLVASCGLAVLSLSTPPNSHLATAEILVVGLGCALLFGVIGGLENWIARSFTFALAAGAHAILPALCGLYSAAVGIWLAAGVLPGLGFGLCIRITEVVIARATPTPRSHPQSPIDGAQDRCNN